MSPAPGASPAPGVSPAPVLAAGAVVWRAESSQLEICLVHRPKYDDWSLPKGKPDAGEHILACAAREVAEETGHRVTLGRPLPVQRYEAGRRLKQVHYWLAAADPDAGLREADDEVDEVVFLPVADAVKRLTYPRDVDLVRRSVRGPIRTTPLVLLRHTRSVSRSAWTGRDLERPLDRRGALDATALVAPLDALGPQRVITSDAVRCVDTVRPFTSRHGLTVELEPLLSEERLQFSERPHPAVKIMRALLLDGPALVCTHRPVLPLLFETAGVDAGAELSPGGFVVLHHRGGVVVATDRHDP